MTKFRLIYIGRRLFHSSITVFMCYGQKPHIIHWILESLFIILPLSLLPLQAQKIQAKQMMTLDLLSVKYELLGWYKDIFNPLMVPLNKINDHKDIGKSIGMHYYNNVSSFRIIILQRSTSVWLSIGLLKRVISYWYHSIGFKS